MIKSFTIKNFRCFREIRLKPLARVNLITGENNLGKTAILEALFLYAGGHNPELSLRLNLQRGFNPPLSEAEDTWGWLFSGRQLDKSIELTCEDSQGETRKLTIELGLPEKTQVPLSDKTNGGAEKPSGSITGVAAARQLKLKLTAKSKMLLRSSATIAGDNLEFSVSRTMPLPMSSFLSTHVRIGNENLERFSKLAEVGREQELIETLKIVEPRLKRLTLHKVQEVTTIRGDIGIGRLVPVALMGSGLGQLLSMVLSILSCPDGIVLIDEIENGFHHSVLSRVWEAIAEVAAGTNVQVFGTTHSRECVEAAHQAFSERLEYDFRLHRLEKAKDGIRAVTYDREQIATSVDMNLEVR